MSNWNDFPVGYQNEIIDFLNQWNQLSGYQHVGTINVGNTALMAKIADHQPSSLSEFSRFLWSAGAGDFNHPWAGVGLSQDQYNQKINDIQDNFQRLTGKTLDLTLGNPASDMNLVWGWLSQGLTGSQVSDKLTQDATMQKQYGWLKYGLDFNQFQTQKLTMNALFGRTLSNEEAVTQLQYLHTNQGSDMAVHTQATLTQVEKQQAYTGASGSAVR